MLKRLGITLYNDTMVGEPWLDKVSIIISITPLKVIHHPIMAVSRVFYCLT
jgi:hypothetical protein